MPVFNSQVRPTYASPQQKSVENKMNILNDSTMVNAYQQFPIQSKNGGFMENTVYEKLPEDVNV